MRNRYLLFFNKVEQGKKDEKNNGEKDFLCSLPAQPHRCFRLTVLPLLSNLNRVKKTILVSKSCFSGD